LVNKLQQRHLAVATPKLSRTVILFFFSNPSEKWWLELVCDGETLAPNFPSILVEFQHDDRKM
jgi:hypothetical protein